MDRRLGSTGRSIGSIGLGCMGMSWGYAENTRNDDTSVRVIREAVDRGVTMIDTALVYGDGHNEELVGQALVSTPRENVVVATKGGLVVEDLAARRMRRDGTPANLARQIDDSLRRLQMDHIDLYYLHRVDENVSLEDSWGALSNAVDAGKIRWLGLSEVTIDQASRAHRLHPVTAIQSELSLWTRGPLGFDGAPSEQTAAASAGGAAATTSEPLVDWASDNNVAFVPFAPLGRGFLTGGITEATTFDATDFRASNPRFQAEALAHNTAISDAVAEVASRHGSTPAQVAIAWVLHQGEHVIPIPGTRNLAHLDDNLGAARLALSGTDLEQLAALPAPIGSRY